MDLPLVPPATQHRRVAEPERRHSVRLRGLLFVVAAVGVATLARLGLEPFVGDRAPFLQYFLAVVLAAWYWGFAAGIAASIASAALSALLFLDASANPHGAQSEVAVFILFVITSFVISAVGGAARSAVVRAERHADRTARLQAVTGSVARPLGPREVAAAILNEGLAGFGAGRGLIALVDEPSRTVNVLSATGYEAEVMTTWARFALDGNYPVSEAIRRRDLVVLADSEVARRRYPELSETFPDAGCAVVVPLLFEHRAIGALYWRFEVARSFDADDRADLLAIGHQCALALERARLYARERETANRSAMLARAGEVLASTLDARRSVAKVVRLIVPEIADRCAVYVVNPTGRIELLALHDRDEVAARRARHAVEGHPPTTADPDGAGAVIREGRPEPATAARLDSGGGSVGTSLTVPLVVRGHVMGALAIANEETARPLSDNDSLLVAELGRRIGAALDNSRLYRDLRAREAQQAAVARLGQRAVEEEELDKLLDAAATEAAATLDVEFVEILARDSADEAQGLLLVAGVGWRPGLVGHARISAVAESQAGYTLLSHEPVIVRDLATETRFQPSSLLREHGVVSAMSVVIGSVDAPWGALGIQTTQLRAFTADDVNFLSSVANVLAGAIDRQRKLDSAREAQEIGRAFIGVVNHELRTPITTIYAGAKLLSRLPPGDAEHAELTADVEAEADRLYRLTEDLLVLTRLERDDLEIAREPVLVNHLLGRVVASERRRWPLTSFRIAVEPGLAAATGEDSYIEQVLRNLVGNAAKYSPAGSTVEVRVEMADDEVVVRVLDEGPGIGLGEEAELFALFYRSPATAQQASGAGIGLFVCQRLIAAMGGRLWAVNRPEGGSEFGFALSRYGNEDEYGPSDPVAAGAPAGIAGDVIAAG